MSFLKIRDPTKRNQMVEEYLELKKNIRGNLLSERTGEQQLQTDLSKFYRPITETQKDTARVIREGLKPIKEGIVNLPQAMQPMENLLQAIVKKEKEEEEEKEEEVEEEKPEASPENLGDIAYNYLHRKYPYPRDTTFGIYVGKDGYYHMGKQLNKENKKILTTAHNNIIIEDEKFRGTSGLWELIMDNNPRNYTKEDKDEYGRLLIKANVLHRNFDPKNPNPRSSISGKWTTILSPIWYEREKYEGKGVVIMAERS